MHLPGDVRGAQSLAAQFLHQGPVHRGLAAEADPLFARLHPALAGPLLQPPPLGLGLGDEHGQHHPGQAVLGCDVVLEKAQAHAGRIESADQLDQFVQVAAEPVEPGDEHRVAGAHRALQPLQTGALGPAAGGGVGEQVRRTHAVTAEDVNLRVERRLTDGGAGIAENGHGWGDPSRIDGGIRCFVFYVLI